jgi:hypothetical protein
MRPYIMRAWHLRLDIHRGVMDYCAITRLHFNCINPSAFGQTGIDHEAT